MSHDLEFGEDQHHASQGVPCDDFGRPMGIYAGKVPNPHILYGQDDIETGPVTFARYNMSRGVHDVQLNNGWQHTNYGKRTVYASSGYLNEVQPEIPGQSRLFGGSISSNFVPRGPAPANYQNVVNAAQTQPSNPGGPGQAMGRIVVGSGARG